MGVVLRCPECRGKFRLSNDAVWPDSCPLCHEFIGPDDDTIIAMPALRSAATKAHDAVYRATEAASEVRMEQAAQLAGTSVEDMSSLKITDLQPTLHQGDVAARRVTPENNAVAATMAAMAARGAPVGFGNVHASEYAGAVSSGPLPNAGAKMRQALHNHHSAASHGGLVSDRPALETLQPGYRRRA